MRMPPRALCARAAAVLSMLRHLRVPLLLRPRRKAYDGGKVFAQRHTFYDMIFAVLSGRQEENAFSFVLSCVRAAEAALSRAAPARLCC